MFTTNPNPPNPNWNSSNLLFQWSKTLWISILYNNLIMVIQAKFSQSLAQLSPSLFLFCTESWVWVYNYNNCHNIIHTTLKAILVRKESILALYGMCRWWITHSWSPLIKMLLFIHLDYAPIHNNHHHQITSSQYLSHFSIKPILVFTNYLTRINNTL